MANVPSYEEKTGMQYDTFIKKALNTERKWFFKELRQQMERQSLFCELDESQTEYFEDSGALETFADIEAEFEVLKYTVAVRDVLLYYALSQIDERARNIILMAFWLEMSDQEIADQAGMKRSTVNYIRNKTYKKLKEILEADGHESSSYFLKH